MQPSLCPVTPVNWRQCKLAEDLAHPCQQAERHGALQTHSHSRSRTCCSAQMCSLQKTRNRALQGVMQPVHTRYKGWMFTRRCKGYKDECLLREDKTEMLDEGEMSVGNKPEHLHQGMKQRNVKSLWRAKGLPFYAGRTSLWMLSNIYTQIHTDPYLLNGENYKFKKSHMKIQWHENKTRITKPRKTEEKKNYSRFNQRTRWEHNSERNEKKNSLLLCSTWISASANRSSESKLALSHNSPFAVYILAPLCLCNFYQSLHFRDGDKIRRYCNLFLQLLFVFAKLSGAWCVPHA